MRCLERDAPDKATGIEPRGRLDGGDLECCRVVQGRHETGEPLGEQGLAYPGHPDHREVVPTGSRDLERTPGLRLSAYVSQVRHVRFGLRAVVFGSPFFKNEILSLN